MRWRNEVKTRRSGDVTGWQPLLCTCLVLTLLEEPHVRLEKPLGRPLGDTLWAMEVSSSALSHPILITLRGDHLDLHPIDEETREGEGFRVEADLGRWTLSHNPNLSPVL